MQSRITRRKLAGLLGAATAAVTAQAQSPQPTPQPAAAVDEVAAAREQAKRNAEQIARVKLPMSTEPAATFRAQ